MSKIKKIIKWFVVLILIFIFSIVTAKLMGNALFHIDDFVYHHVSVLISPTWTYIFKAITSLASFEIILIISFLFFIINKNKRCNLLILVNLITTFLLNNGLKMIFSRPRPLILPLIIEKGYSYPSGHAMMAMGFYGFFIYLLLKSKNNKSSKKILITFLALLILLIGLSRVYLGVHYITDIIAGFSISLAYLIIYTSILNKYISSESRQLNVESKSIGRSFMFAIEGIKSSLKTERNMYNHFSTAGIVIVFGIICKINVYEWIICIILFGLVIASELINTAIETTIDMYTKKINPQAKLAKDIVAGAVLILCFISVIVGLIIFAPKLYLIIFN